MTKDQIQVLATHFTAIAAVFSDLAGGTTTTKGRRKKQAPAEEPAVDTEHLTAMMTAAKDAGIDLPKSNVKTPEDLKSFEEKAKDFLMDKAMKVFGEAKKVGVTGKDAKEIVENLGGKGVVLSQFGVIDIISFIKEINAKMEQTEVAEDDDEDLF